MAKSSWQVDQLPLPYEQRKQLWVERIRLIEAVHFSRTGETSESWWKVVALLKTVHRNDLGEGCSLLRGELIERMDEVENCKLSLTKFKQVKRKAKELGVLEVTARAHGEGRGRSADLYRVNYTALAALGADHEDGDPDGRGSERLTVGSERPTDNSERLTARNDRPTVSTGPIIKEDYSYTPLKALSSTPPPSTKEELADLTTSNEEEQFELLIEELVGYDVRAAAKAIDRARGRQATAMAIRAVIDFWRTHRPAWRQPAYALYLRILHWSATQSPEDGWLPWSEEYSRRQESADNRAKRHRDLMGQKAFEAEVDRLWNALSIEQQEEVRRGLSEHYPRLQHKPDLFRRWLLTEIRDEKRGTKMTELLAPLLPTPQQFVR